ncbi:hypothetical protein PIL02S_01276 [Paenibacillus illinoisensis]|uniref:Uncharacterized protein n=1 Tax=Paenibacillus illinoisensis TaxID=59845 RepID=A0A2W0CC90_9BACL|nr:hypothetical protein PIL02S_01276 [Paenibacillus illinoisensis]
MPAHINIIPGKRKTVITINRSYPFCTRVNKAKNRSKIGNAIIIKSTPKNVFIYFPPELSMYKNPNYTTEAIRFYQARLSCIISNTVSASQPLLADFS